jgi:hypothetical protein
MIADEVESDANTIADTKHMAATSSDRVRTTNQGFLRLGVRRGALLILAIKEKVKRPPEPISTRISEMGMESDNCLIMASSMAKPAIAITM